MSENGENPTSFSSPNTYSTQDQPTYPATPPARRSLSRPRHGRVIAGVCAGVARHFGWDPTIVRVVTVASLLLPGPQILLYLGAWLLMPEDGA